MRKLVVLIGSLMLLIGCGDDTLPKPKAFLALNYPQPKYALQSNQLPFTAQLSTIALVKSEKNQWFDVHYPSMKAMINITYHPVQNNLSTLVSDAEKLTYKHTIKADNIEVFPYENASKKIYARLFEVNGDAASTIQFQVTDSTKHFINGSLYFDARPNYDSIYPAIQYLKKDIKKMIETLEWK